MLQVFDGMVVVFRQNVVWSEFCFCQGAKWMRLPEKLQVDRKMRKSLAFHAINVDNISSESWHCKVGNELFGYMG